MSQSIFTVTAVDIHDKSFGRCRCFGFFFDFEKATKAVLANEGGMQECKYTHIVIEQQGEHIHNIADVVAWYEWLLDPETYEGFWHPCKRPEVDSIAHTVNFNGIG
jgi:hypothetical protein